MRSWVYGEMFIGKHMSLLTWRNRERHAYFKKAMQIKNAKSICMITALLLSRRLRSRLEVERHLAEDERNNQLSNILLYWGLGRQATVRERFSLVQYTVLIQWWMFWPLADLVSRQDTLVGTVGKEYTSASMMPGTVIIYNPECTIGHCEIKHFSVRIRENRLQFLRYWGGFFGISWTSTKNMGSSLNRSEYQNFWEQTGNGEHPVWDDIAKGWWVNWCIWFRWGLARIWT